MASNGSTVVNKTSKFAVFDVKGGEQTRRAAAAAAAAVHGSGCRFWQRQGAQAHNRCIADGCTVDAVDEGRPSVA